MISNISVSDLINYKGNNVKFNEIIINEQDIIDNMALMHYLEKHNIYFEKELKLKELPQFQQNEIGLLFIEYFGFCIRINDILYFNKNKMLQLFSELEAITLYLNKAIYLFEKTSKDTELNLSNVININSISDNNLNEIILNFFSLNYRNYKSYDKHIISTDVLFDIDIEHGKFKKITSLTQLMLTQFDRFIRTLKGSIPFSSDTGSDLKRILQSKSSIFTKKFIVEEISSFLLGLESIYNETFSIVSIDYSEIEYISTHIEVKIVLQAAEEEPVSIRIIGDNLD